MPNSIPTTNPPAILRSRHLASKYFGADDMMPAVMTSIPRTKYMFFARLIPDAQALSQFPWMRNLDSPGVGGVSFKIKNIDKPRVELNTVELNQYNRKRHAYSKVNYQPFVIRLHDTVDNAPLRLWKDYFLYYFGDSRANKTGVMNESTVGETFGDSTGWGLRPIAEDLSFFSEVQLFSLYGRKYTQLNYLNPKITNVDFTQYDSSSSETDEVAMTFKYEAIEYLDERQIDASMAAVFGFDVDSPPIEPVVSPSSTNTYANRTSPANLTSVYASFKNLQSGQSVLNTDQSVLTNFGLNSGAYQTLTQTNNQNAATTSFVPQTLMSAPSGGSPNILGIPSGALPMVTGQISGSMTMASLPATASTLSAYGSFSFGSR